MATAEPTADTVAERTFTDNLRRIFRRQPDMGHEPVDVHLAVAAGGIALVLGAVFGVIMVLLASTSPMALMITSMPVMLRHLEGVRHRWWALGAAIVAAIPAGLAVSMPLGHRLPTGWADLLAVLAASAVAMAVQAAVTHIPYRGRPDGRT